MSEKLADHFPPRPSAEQAAEIRRRQRGRNVAVALTILAVSVLFFAITVVKLSHSG